MNSIWSITLLIDFESNAAQDKIGLAFENIFKNISMNYATLPSPRNFTSFVNSLSGICSLRETDFVCQILRKDERIDHNLGNATNLTVSFFRFGLRAVILFRPSCVKYSRSQQNMVANMAAP
jgi:hypothetical protein